MRAHDNKLTNLLFDPPEPLRIASRPVASIVATMADGGAVSSWRDISAQVPSPELRVCRKRVFVRAQGHETGSVKTPRRSLKQWRSHHKLWPSPLGATKQHMNAVVEASQREGREHLER